jgi:hypothetical protein
LLEEFKVREDLEEISVVFCEESAILESLRRYDFEELKFSVNLALSLEEWINIFFLHLLTQFLVLTGCYLLWTLPIDIPYKLLAYHS